jgi:hypothetical protein
MLETEEIRRLTLRKLSPELRNSMSVISDLDSILFHMFNRGQLVEDKLARLLSRYLTMTH